MKINYYLDRNRVFFRIITNQFVYYNTEFNKLYPLQGIESRIANFSNNLSINSIPGYLYANI